MGAKVQIVEDEAIAAMLLKINLDDWGYYCIDPVSSGDEAIALAKREHPDIILMDINLIGSLDGIEAAENILAFSSPKIIFMTGFDDQNTRGRAEALNPSAYLTKPYDTDQLKLLLDDISN